MRIQFIGTGNANGTPTPGCECTVCREAQINLERRRRVPCVAISTPDDTASLVIDAGASAITSWLGRPTTMGIFLSHFHPGHFHSLLAHRRDRGTTPLFCPPDPHGIESIAPNLQGFEIHQPSPFTKVELKPFEVIPVLLNHDLITYGYCVACHERRLAYLCDTCGLPPHTTQFLADWKPDALIIDCNQHPKFPNPTHNTPKEALKIHHSVGAKNSYLTHIGCRVDAYLSARAKTLPASVKVAHDGMVVDLNTVTQTAPTAYV